MTQSEHDSLPIAEEADGTERQVRDDKDVASVASDTPDLSRRRFLVGAASIMGGIGAACAGIPFLASWAPSVRAQALGAPIEVDISQLEPGQRMTVAWRGKPVFIVRRTPAELSTLEGLASQLRDPLSQESLQPAYAHNMARSIRPEILVLMGVCTHLGCVPLYKPEVGALESAWVGGFFCPCHGSKYDLAGRVYRGVPAPLNLEVPPYQYLNDTLLLIGDDKQAVGNTHLHAQAPLKVRIIT